MSFGMPWCGMRDSSERQWGAVLQIYNIMYFAATCAVEVERSITELVIIRIFIQSQLGALLDQLSVGFCNHWIISTISIQ